MSKTTSHSESSDPDPRASATCLDLLLIELVPLAYRITEQLHARDQALIAQLQRSKLDTGSTQWGASAGGLGEKAGVESARESEGMGGAGGLGEGLEGETRDKVFWRLDNMGYRVGQGLAERFSTNKPRPQTALDAIKFVCKDLWQLIFRKPIDNLKTNHRGIFVLTDNRFQPLSRMSVDRRAGARAFEEAMRMAQAYMYFPCGIIRGALASLGLDVTVTAESTELPMGTFHIKTRGAKP